MQLRDKVIGTIRDATAGALTTPGLCETVADLVIKVIDDHRRAEALDLLEAMKKTVVKAGDVADAKAATTNGTPAK